MNLATPERGFPNSEYEHRTRRVQKKMAEDNISAILLTTEPEIRYFSGFFTQFWQSPTRPWVLIIPEIGKPIAIIPEIGAARMATTWIDDIRTWPAPRPEDDGFSELSDCLAQLANKGGKIGLPMGHETHIRMPNKYFEDLKRKLRQCDFTDCTDIIKALRMIKSEREIAKIRYICQLTSSSFENLDRIASIGSIEREIFRNFRVDLIRRGADDVPYLVGGSGLNGPKEVIGPASGRRLEKGDVLMMDTGAIFDGYYCDFDRNFAFGTASGDVQKAYEIAFRATETGLKNARPGVAASDLWHAMVGELETSGVSGGAIGRLGHGLGMQLTESPSHMASDKTVLKAGMVITLEPSFNFADGQIMVHEENLVVRDGEPELLSRRAPPEIPIVF